MDAPVAPGTATDSMGPTRPQSLPSTPPASPRVGMGTRCPLGSPRLGLGGPAKPSSAQRPRAGPQLGFTLLLRQKPVIKPLAKGQSRTHPRGAQLGGEGCRDLPLPRAAHVTPSTHRGRMPNRLSITPASSLAPSLGLQGMPKVLPARRIRLSPPRNGSCCQQPAR